MLKTEIFKNEDGDFIIFPNDAIANHIKSGRLWEPHFREILKLINKGDCVIDGGANFGYNSVMIGKRLHGSGVLYAFEPQRIIYQQLNANLILNNIFNAYTINLALSNVNNEEVIMDYVDYNANWVNIGDTSIGHGGESVNTITLDYMNFPRVDFIKLDVQGYEPFVLMGCSDIIKNFMPYIFIEIETHQLAKFQKTPTDIFDILKKYDYNIFKIDNEYPCDHICCSNKQLENVMSLNLPLVRI
jgi:FkbM family methyltransferase